MCLLLLVSFRGHAGDFLKLAVERSFAGKAGELGDPGHGQRIPAQQEFCCIHPGLSNMLGNGVTGVCLKNGTQIVRVQMHMGGDLLQGQGTGIAVMNILATV